MTSPNSLPREKYRGLIGDMQRKDGDLHLAQGRHADAQSAPASEPLSDSTTQILLP